MGEQVPLYDEKVLTLFKLLGNKRLFIMLFGLILFIALMGFTLGGRLNLSWPEKFVHDTVTFVQQIFYKPAAYVSEFIEDVSNLKDVHEENERLKIAVAQYTRDKAHYNAIQAQNESLMEALKFTERQKKLNLPYEYRIAQVTSINVADPFNQTINVNLGSKNGVRQGMPVISVEGVVGMISRVYEFSSTVQLLTNLDDKDPSSRPISATIMGKEKKSFGMIESYDHSSGTFSMTRIEEDDEIAEGDTVVSSGEGGIFPKGLILGTVISINIGEFGLTRTATVQPAATYRDWRELFIVITPDLNETGKEAK
ncbi:rod shape-determining protein MreC [Paenibacillus apiarius]|uniref:Cell shape-determining protein MreC n=1 Tax=Paenibacillus apiarius TaxID=46240 RepID=A0ABT4DYV5_9BACL|nr:rod shape-determining protein MreC [Paenibacillus apiarius]MBN3525659.1 rod shape-determining protein MreC [Paenibacillus apiarius]MCY9516542.1 rod shape-determining protein MreC [Paenibacillus apiarius]MCY9522533.1 rod shape-determining protein MreC [Paenibacillus apiarius]MCY9554543.1 rod shape-determining protein MreC [Paenibacillus apiarius]MCY9556659.1 rod shape-determining protein MreC [Paenibacillus apiarius]